MPNRTLCAMQDAREVKEMFLFLKGHVFLEERKDILVEL